MPIHPTVIEIFQSKPQIGTHESFVPIQFIDIEIFHWMSEKFDPWH